MSVVSGGTLEAQKLDQLSDYAAYLPALNLDVGGVPSLHAVQLRGISFPYGPGVQAVGFSIDDAPIAIADNDSVAAGQTVAETGNVLTGTGTSSVSADIAGADVVIVDARGDAVVRYRWPPESAKAKAVPSVAALRMQLAWTGWRKTRRFTDYRPGTTEALFLCEKTDELDEGTGLAPAVSAHRPDVSAR
jgi:hypothetical protein